MTAIILVLCAALAVVIEQFVVRPICDALNIAL